MSKLAGFIVTFLLLIGTAGAVEPTAPEIAISKKVEVSGDTVLLGDIARISGDEGEIAALKELPLGKTPSPGSYRILKSRKIVAYLEKRGWGRVTVQAPEEINVWRRASLLPEDELMANVRETLIRKMPWAREEVKITVASLNRNILLPQGRLSFHVEVPDKFNFIGTELVSVDVMVDDKKEKSLWVKSDIKVYLDMLVAARPLLKNETLSESDVMVKRKLVSSLRREIFNSASPVIGMRVKRAIKKGALITDADIVLPPLFKRGNMVTILAEKGPLVISTVGKALEKGFKGKMVRIENVSSKKIIMAEAVDAKTVKIRF